MVVTEVPLQPAAHKARIALFIYGLSGGGAQRRTVTLARAIAERGYRVDLVVVRREGPVLSEVSPLVNIVDLHDWGMPRFHRRISRRIGVFIAAAFLARYLETQRPRVLLSAASHVHFGALLARWLARRRTRLVLRASNHLSRTRPNGTSRPRKFSPWLARRCFRSADAIIAVCDDVADDVARVTGFPRERLTTIYNPMMSADLRERAAAPLDHPWFAPGSPPVILGVGRLAAQKDFATLVRAFARVRATRPARLLILGNTKKVRRKKHLERLIYELGVDADARLGGFVPNPLPYMVRSSVFVLSSAWEGLPGVLIEAMACGCPVVSTDCPGGPAEIMDHGAYGPLVRVGDDTALAQAILRVLAEPPDAQRLRERAAKFPVEVAVNRYLDVLLEKGVGGDSFAEPTGVSATAS